MRVLLFIVLVFVGLSATAQTISFRSGDHPDFARLVLDIPAGRAWTIGRIGTDYSLDLGPGLDFDLSGAFARIPRNRLRDIDIDVDSGRLILRIACRCHVAAFLFRPDKLVIDVTDGPPPPDSPWETAIADASPETPRAIPLLGPAQPTTLLLSTLQPAPTDIPSEPGALPQLDALAVDMARAVAAGVLDPAVSFAAPIEPEPRTIAEAPPSTLTPPLPEQAAQPGVMFITSDLLQRTTAGPREVADGGESCRPEAEFDLAAWAQTGRFSQDIGSLRQDVIDAAGALDSDALTDLARAYLHFGFGAEARQVLEFASEDSSTHRILGHLADLIDGLPVVADQFSGQSGCLTPVALWSALAMGSIANRTQEERTAIETAFRVLPPGPRQAIGPRLAALFLAEGHPGSAAAILERTPAQASGNDEALAVESDILRDAASAAAARDVLLTAIRSGSRASAGTMVRLVDATLAAGLPVEPWMTETLAALRFEYRDSAIGELLTATELNALVAAGRFSEADDLLAETGLAMGEAARNRHRMGLALALTERASDGEFLDLAFRMSGELPPGAAANAVAGRLIGLGFPDVALEILATPSQDDAMEDRRSLRAEALRALGQDLEATLVLGGMSPVDASAATATTAWRSDDWPTLVRAEDPLLSAVAASLLDDAPRLIAADSLADRAALIAESEETRRLAQELLDRFPAPGENQALPGVSQ